MVKKTLFALVLMIATLFGSGCFGVQVEEDVDFPAGSFAEVRERLVVMERHNPERSGTIAKMHVMVYDGQSREFVKVALPVWLVKKAKDHARHDHRQQPADAAGRYIDLDWSELEDISRLGPGLLVQVEDMRENTHVLVWLE